MSYRPAFLMRYRAAQDISDNWRNRLDTEALPAVTSIAGAINVRTLDSLRSTELPERAESNSRQGNGVAAD